MILILLLAGFRSDDSCKSYEMKCVFIQGTHNGTTIHNRGAILDDCSCGFETGRLRCSNELLKPEAANCNCKCN